MTCRHCDGEGMMYGWDQRWRHCSSCRGTGHVRAQTLAEMRASSENLCASMSRILAETVRDVDACTTLDTRREGT